MITLTRFAKSFLVITFALLLLTTLSFLHPPTRAYVNPWTEELAKGYRTKFAWDVAMNKEQSGQMEGEEGRKGAENGGKGEVIMPILGNATAKAALGQATWKLLHTMTLRFPEKPTVSEREALTSYLHLTSRLYPCGECATEFQELLAKWPPQTSSRRSAASWLCFIHNKVNERLRKPEFDCAHLDDTYDCGCGDTPLSDSSTSTSATDDPMDLEHDPSKDDVTGEDLIRGGR